MIPSQLPMLLFDDQPMLAFAGEVAPETIGVASAVLRRAPAGPDSRLRQAGSVADGHLRRRSDASTVLRRISG